VGSEMCIRESFKLYLGIQALSRFCQELGNGAPYALLT
jgi:hypothetical protein